MQHRNTTTLAASTQSTTVACQVIVYPVGLMVGNLVLLILARNAILDGKDTPLSRSIAFLYREYDLRTYWWEIAEMVRP